MTEFIGPFRKSSYSGQEGNCVEVAHTATDDRAVRDSKDPDRPMLTFAPSGWQAFIAAAKSGQFGRSTRALARAGTP
ncbi:DUF397 domain-containing protein [Streptomyces adonidis]|uniref:DUF397 domain-containing protein n=1 Tax=Streptomyces adonidis TaxID=3231367 RepID=UPI0034DB403B